MRTDRPKRRQPTPTPAVCAAEARPPEMRSSQLALHGRSMRVAAWPSGVQRADRYGAPLGGRRHAPDVSTARVRAALRGEGRRQRGEAPSLRRNDHAAQPGQRRQSSTPRSARGCSAEPAAVRPTSGQQARRRSQESVSLAFVFRLFYCIAAAISPLNSGVPSPVAGSQPLEQFQPYGSFSPPAHTISFGSDADAGVQRLFNHGHRERQAAYRARSCWNRA